VRLGRDFVALNRGGVRHSSMPLTVRTSGETACTTTSFKYNQSLLPAISGSDIERYSTLSILEIAMDLKVSPLSVSTDDIKKMLTDSGVNNLDDLVEAIQFAANSERKSGGIGRITPMVSYLLKFIKLD
jgi:hypothetical protein